MGNLDIQRRLRCALPTPLLLLLENFFPVDKYTYFQNLVINRVPCLFLLSQCEHFLGQGKSFPVSMAVLLPVTGYVPADMASPLLLFKLFPTSHFF